MIRAMPAILGACRVYGVTLAEVLSPSRRHDVVNARTAIVGWLRHYTHHSYPEIARLLGRRWHSTAHAAMQRFEAMPGEEQLELLMRINDAARA